MTVAPHGLKEIMAFYGDPAHYIRDDGTVSPIWEARMCSVALPAPLPLGWAPTLAKSARVNVAIVAELALVFRLLASSGAWKQLRTYDGGYTWRTKRNGMRFLSMHALGAAVDFDASTNRQGGPGDMSERVVEIFEEAGWTWGGRWEGDSCDPMHFQFGSGY